MGVRGQRQVLAALPPGMTPCHCIGGWSGTRAGLNGCGKSRLPPGCDSPIAQPVASRYTDYAVPAPRIWCKKMCKTTFNKRKFSDAAKESKDMA